MLLTFRPIKLWPEGWDRRRPPRMSSPFKASYRSTLDLLDRELRELRAGDPVLQVDAKESECRLDGQLRANARVDYDGVILSFATKNHGTLTYPCNRFAGTWSNPGWQANLRAIALGLEALRKVERYGIAERGQQYAGWAELPSGIALGKGMTREQAWAMLRDWSGVTSIEVTSDNFDTTVETLYRLAAKRVHPDTSPDGNAETFRRLTEARDLLRAS